MFQINQRLAAAEKQGGVGSGELAAAESLRFLRGMMEESQQNSLQAEMESAEHMKRDVKWGRARQIGFEEAGRRIGETISLDGPHAPLVRQFQQNFRPTHIANMPDGSIVNTRKIGSSRSHRVHSNRLTKGRSEKNPIEVDKTPLMSLFPMGKFMCYLLFFCGF